MCARDREPFIFAEDTFDRTARRSGRATPAPTTLFHLSFIDLGRTFEPPRYGLCYGFACGMVTRTIVPPPSRGAMVSVPRHIIESRCSILESAVCGRLSLAG